MPDFRRNQGKRYELAPVLVIICMALLTNAKELTEISTYTKEKFVVIKKLLNVKWKSPPSYSTIRRICVSINSDKLEKCFREYSFNMHLPTDMKIIGIDGKALRNSFDHTNSIEPIQLISAFLSMNKLVLAHAEIINDKTNEIPKVQALIQELGLTGYIFTMDALHCQHKTLKSVVDSGNNAIVQVKDNQKKLNKLCNKLANSWNPIDTNSDESLERNRHEKRTVKVFNRNTYFNSKLEKHWDKYIACIIRVERETDKLNTLTRKYEKTIEKSFYVSTKILSAKDANIIIRSHWSIENSLHYVRDVSLGEDKSRCRVHPDNFARLRSIALNIMRINGVINIKNELYKNSLNIYRMMNYKFLFN